MLIQVEWSQKDGDSIHKGLQFGKVYGNSGSRRNFLEAFQNFLKSLTDSYAGRAHSIVIAERVVLNFMQRMSGVATLTRVQLFPFCIF